MLCVGARWGRTGDCSKDKARRFRSVAEAVFRGGGGDDLVVLEDFSYCVGFGEDGKDPMDELSVTEVLLDLGEFEDASE